MAKLTATDMFNETRLIFEDMASMSAPGYTPAEMSVKLTQAMESVVVDKIATGFDRNENVRRAVSSLIKFGEISGADITAAGIYTNGYNVSLTSLETANDYWYAVGEFATSTHATKGTLSQVIVEAVEWQDVLQNVDNPYKKPCDYVFWKLTYNGNTVVITDGSTLTKLHVTYLRKPAPIIVPETAIEGFKYFPVGDTATSLPITEGWSVVTAITGAKQVLPTVGQDCELDDSIHREICERAAKMIYSSIKDVQGYQIAENEDK